MTSAWSFPHCKVSPPSRLIDQCTNGRNSVFSDPGYSSAANSVSSEYQENDFAYFDNQVSPRYESFSTISNMDPIQQDNRPLVNNTSVKTEDGFASMHYSDINAVDQFSKMQQQQVPFNKHASINLNSRRNRSTSDLEGSRLHQINSCLPAQLMPNYANTMHRSQVEIPSISVEDYVMSNENVFNDSTEEVLMHDNYPQHAGNGQYLSTGSRAGSRLPSTESFYEESVASKSPLDHSPAQCMVGFNDNSNPNYSPSGRSRANRVFVDMNSTSTPIKQPYMEDDDAWNYLEQPSSANLNSDCTFDASMGRLYEYYKVPQENRVQTCQLLSDVEMSKNNRPTQSHKPTETTARVKSTPYANLSSQMQQNPTSATTTFDSKASVKQTFSSNICIANSKDDEFFYVMEAPKSLKQKEKEPTMSYINKGQFYCITLRRNESFPAQNTKMRSVVQVVFGDSKPEEEQQRHWRYWHARQHTAKQRIIDIADYKESNMIYDIEEIAHNAIAFTWDPSKEAKIYISCNCLSTDFSAQKGIKGLPLLIQIDTYPNEQSTKMHRGVCQIKVFCDKGAERKIRDEERKALRKTQKNSGNKAVMTVAANNYLTLAGTTSSKSKNSTPTVTRKLDEVIFKTSLDFSKPVHFIPDIINHAPSTQTKSQTTATQPILMGPNQLSAPASAESMIDDTRLHRKRSFYGSNESIHSKVPRTDIPRSVLLYVRSEKEEIYNGLMLRTPNVFGLKSAIEEKYSYPATHITQLLKRSKKGVVVNMDDNIIQHYCDEDTFILTVQTSNAQNGQKLYSVTLSEI